MRFRLWQVRMDSLLSYKMQGHIFRCIYSCLYQLISSAHVQCGRTYGRCMKLQFRNECFSHPPGVNRLPNAWWYTIEAVRPNARFSTAPMKYFPNIFCQHVCSSYERWIWFYARWANSGRTLCLGKLYYLHPAQPPTIKLIFDHHPSGQRTSSKNKKNKMHHRFDMVWLWLMTIINQEYVWILFFPVCNLIGTNWGEIHCLITCCDDLIMYARITRTRFLMDGI